MIYSSQTHKGFLLPQILVFASISILLISAIISWAGTSMKASRTATDKEQAFQIAEAGIEYYRWHLAHSALDFQDGTATSGPYIHTYTNANGDIIGQFTLTITPPPSGSTIVTIVATGTVGSTTVSRALEAKLAIPSLSKYAFAANSDMRFGAGTEVFGPIHSNGGIHFDGLAHNVVTSAKDKYTDPDHGGGVQEYGVHTHQTSVDPFPPTAVPNRVDIFEVGRQFPVPAVDFNGFASDLAGIKTKAQAVGSYLAPSGKQGYLIVFATNDTYGVYKVNTLMSAPGGCTNSAGQTGWGTWSISSAGGSLTWISTSTLPSNNIIFAEDNVWVQGKINTARVTIGAGRFPEDVTNSPAITVNYDLSYTNYDGQDVVALFAQGDINVGLKSDNDLRIDASLLAKNGRIGRYYYGSSCGTEYKRSTTTLYGMLATNLRYGFAYTDGTGYANRQIIYDANLLYGPPPEFPLASDQYSIISWRELK